jgi:ribosomal-protein-alanine N-acetyltransferase
MTTAIHPDPAKPEPVLCHVRWMIRRDMAEVLETEAAVFPFDHTEEDLLKLLRRRNYIGMVAEHGEYVIGHMVYELHKERLHVLCFAVNPNRRRRTVGRQMILKLKSKLSSHRRTSISIDVPESLTGMQVFLRGEGFKASTVEREAFGSEDGYRMEFWLGEPEPVEPTNRLTVNCGGLP